jgi:NADH-quinone oxidoreductase subunit L
MGAVSAIALASTGLSALITLLIGAQFLTAPPADGIYRQVLWSWIGVADFTPRIALALDALSLLMTFVITFVGFLIHLYSTEFMADDDGYNRFFAYMNLFVAAMLLLVLGDNLLLLYLGWEGVGLCSYLLIGYWYRDPFNGYAARKAFVVTRIGDTAMAIEVMLNAAGLAFIGAGAIWGEADGQIMFILVITLAAAEVSVGLALILQIHRRLPTLDADAASTLRG